jgi:hypothetical protein
VSAWLHEIKHDGFRVIDTQLTGDAMIIDMRDRTSRRSSPARQQRTTLTEASPPFSDGTL